jgi:hypothetical protein
MSTELSKYSIKTVDGYFVVIDSAAERVSTCGTEEAAPEEIAECEMDDML